MTTDIDKLRRDLHLARKGLSDCTKALAASEEREAKLREENSELKRKMRQAALLLLPEDTRLSDSWDNFQEPGY